jgi:hypothetical protein
VTGCCFNAGFELATLCHFQFSFPVSRPGDTAPMEFEIEIWPERMSNCCTVLDRRGYMHSVVVTFYPHLTAVRLSRSDGMCSSSIHVLAGDTRLKALRIIIKPTFNKSNSDMATVVGKRETGRLYPCTLSFCTTYRSLLEADHDVFRVMSSIRYNRRSVAAAQSNSTGMDLRSAHLPSNLDLMHLMVDTISAAAISSRLTSVMSKFPLPAVRRHDMRKNIT